MTFNFARMLRLAHRSLFASRGTHARLTPKRILVILLLFPTYVVLQLLNWAGLWLDEILFPGYRRQEVREPVFIVGVPRSGTTFLQRLLAADEEQFTSMRLWEVLFAPSVTQKKIWTALGRVDRGLGGPISSLILAWEKRSFEKVRRYHKVSLFEAEEDEPILATIFSTAFLSFVFPFEDEFRPLVRFDMELPAPERARIMTFYKRCIQRHLFVFGPRKRFLSKNPAFSTKVRSIQETFPDAKIICMVRTPLEAVPSTISLLSFLYGVCCSPLEPHPMREATLQMIADFYRYPLVELERWRPDCHAILRYDHLIMDPARMVVDLYSRFGLVLGPRYRLRLGEESDKARRYSSGHSYSLSEFGLSPAAIVGDFADIFERFGFETGGTVAATG